MNLSIDNKKSLELKKHINAIHCSNNLTLIQRKLFNVLLFHAYPELPHKSRFQLKAKELCRLIGYNSNDYKGLKKSLLGLITTAIEWNILDYSSGKEKQWKASSILAAAELSNGSCIYEYSYTIKELLYQPDIYGRINISLISKFKSSYGLALYENCIRYQGLQQTPWFTIDVFRSLMGVFGNKYLTFRDFKKRVLDIAIDEVNHISSIVISPEFERQNQKVTSIRFKLNERMPRNDLGMVNVRVPEDLVDTLSRVFGLSQQLITEVFSNYSMQYINEKIELIMKSQSFLSGKIRDLAGYLTEALKKDYKISKSSRAVVGEYHGQEKIKREAKKNEEDIKKNRYVAYIHKKIDDYLSSLSNTDSEELELSFAKYIENQNEIFQGWFRKYKFEHPGIKSMFYDYVQETRQEELKNLLLYEDFLLLMKEYQQH